VRDEQGNFVRQWDSILAKLNVLDEQVKADATRLDEQKKMLETHGLMFQARKTQRDELIDQVRTAQDKAGVEQANLAKLQQQLFDLQREIAAARVENENLEASIRSKELGR